MAYQNNLINVIAWIFGMLKDKYTNTGAFRVTSSKEMYVWRRPFDNADLRTVDRTSHGGDVDYSHAFLEVQQPKCAKEFYHPIFTTGCIQFRREVDEN